MAEEQAEYVTDTQDAMEMLGTGYEHPSVEISPPHAVMERRGNEFTEVVKPAFVKISTGFKSEMSKIDEIALKVWLYISLSVNRYSGRANPGLRTIAQDCNLAVNTVRAAIERLENEYNLMTVDRESKRYNIYEPLAFVSANHADPGVSSADTPVSVEGESVSVESESVSPRVILNQINQSNQTYKPNRKEAKERIAKQRAAKGDIFDLLAENAEEVQMIRDMRVRVEAATGLGLTREWDKTRSPWNGYEKTLIKREVETGQTIEQFMDWYNSDDFRKKGNIWLDPDKIEMWWSQAFEKNEPEPEINYVRYDPEEDKQYAPPPKTRPKILR